ncbi:titin [Eupeodes corollae]|uniref:titin n=1 Tax=Eupeodes corollae TaxID=290404 RepID=UPI0024906485|nr:titin [Eupeodes corollae]
MESILSDESILKNSKLWSDAMKEFCEKETFKEVEYYDILNDSVEVSDDCTPDQTIISNNDENDNQNEGEVGKENKCKALVKVEDFEGSTSSDDFEECANHTLALMREQQDKWQKTGMLKVLQTFDWDQISKVVAPWVAKNKLDRSQLSTSVDEHIVHIEEHHHRQVHLSSDDDSLHSLDTANYIRSSRKKKRTSCTTTTIKKFSYVKGSRRHLQKKYGLDLDKDLNKIFHQKFPENAEKIAHRGLKAIAVPEENARSFNCTPPARLGAIEHVPRSLPTMARRKSRQMKRRSDISKRSVSSSSSSSSSPVRLLKPKYKRLSKGRKSHEGLQSAQTKQEKSKLNFFKRKIPERKLVPEAEIDLTKMETSASGPEMSISTRKVEKSLPKPRPTPPALCQSASFSNETGFLGASIINSTAVTTNPSSVPDVPMKKCQLTPIKNKTPPILMEKYQLSPIKNKTPHAPMEKMLTPIKNISHQPKPPRTVPTKKKPKVRLARAKVKKAEEKIVEPKEIEKTLIPVEDPEELEKTATPNEDHKELAKIQIVDEEIIEPKELEKTQIPNEEILDLKELEKAQEEENIVEAKEPEEMQILEEEIVEPKTPEETQIPEKMDNSKILLFSPTDLEPHRQNLTGQNFHLTQDYFVDKVGQKHSQRFIKLNSKKFPFVFDCSSRISFQVPEDTDGSDSSDEDILYVIGREGKLLVEAAEEPPQNKE